MSQENNTQLDKVKKDISAQVLAKVDAFQAAGELRIPKDYSPENALKSAYLILTEQENSQKKPVLEVCTKESIANALLKMVVWGLSPMKKQCDFIPYGNKLECSIEYTGNIVLAKRFGGLKDIKARAIFKQDQFEFEVNPETGKIKIVTHKQTLESIGSKDVVGAYAVMEMADGGRDVEIMSMQQIRDAWNQGAMKGNSPAHKNFPDQMAMKTVINRACKLLIRGSDDAVLFGDDDENAKPLDRVSEDVNQNIRENANKETLSFEDVEDAKFEEIKDEPAEISESETANGPGF
ncbi:recombinase RecT [Chryseobacterium sp. EO14]|uniref:recombinase RecT n=1 Tax=Chryseobacterium sp. EO14 TaxID=2950551 RepID=UPI002108E14F|nr:recombinase RecT [Chryseobacterium sp. EO14]MCQ4139194.1 recombinase RecT [Chryseobacterium sp. EO14]